MFAGAHKFQPSLKGRVDSVVVAEVAGMNVGALIAAFSKPFE
jgi:hypothetical protein